MLTVSEIKMVNFDELDSADPSASMHDECDIWTQFNDLAPQAGVREVMGSNSIGE